MKKHSIMKPLFMRLLIIILPLCGATSQYASESKALAAGVSDGYKQQFPNYVPFVRTPTKEEIELEKRLLQKYNPSQKRCSGAITQNDGLQIASDEGDLYDSRF